MGRKLAIFDSTLRDGAQAQGISFSVEDKIKILKALDDLGIGYIEAGNPGSNPKDLEFFERLKDMRLASARLCAFGSTRRKGIAPSDDANVQSMLRAGTGTVVVFGKSWNFHVTEIIHASLDENLAMIRDTIAFFKSQGKEAIFDAEHFFDGYKADPAYAIECCRAAIEGGAFNVTLCDTNGGSFPDECASITKAVVEALPGASIGIHTPNDGGMAVANAVSAVLAGADMVQGTFVGCGERGGNANLSTIIANLQLKRGFKALAPEKIVELTQAARLVAEIANIPLDDFMPYVGKHCFSHKGGMHIDAVLKNPKSFEHVDPELVGNQRSFLMSEVAGKSTILAKVRKIKPDLEKDSPETQALIDKVKAMEHEGYKFEGADATFELMTRRQLRMYSPFFELVSFKTIGEHPSAEGSGTCAQAIIKIRVGDRTEISAAEGDGPVNALDKALRKALEVFYPELAGMHLVDYKVRVLDSKDASAAKVRVLIESADAEDSWSTVGVSTDIIEASWLALIDSIEYKLIRNRETAAKAV